MSSDLILVSSAFRTVSWLLVLPPWLAYLVWFRKMVDSRRGAMLAASVAWGVSVTALTESLSAFHALAVIPVLICWTVITCISIAVVLFSWENQLDALSLIPKRSEKFNSTSWISVAGIGIILSTTALVCLTSAPNNWDSMTYHLARVANWIDHHSIR